ncbi:MAG: hypothetical protein UR20_C0033G0006 [Candidatus Woesebacteria bacterium GW2011_GWE2_31_6]|nr:MAG: hypothetical protein UR20_C0033G0006 [Candidatus Woesebacteria bacterium GW2011_GWE2_31_6]
MARELYIEAGREDCYKVISKKIKNGKIIKTDTYKTDLRNYWCQREKEDGSYEVCPGFWYTHNCVHLKTVIQLLRSKGIGITWVGEPKTYYTNWDFQDIERELKNQKVYK